MLSSDRFAHWLITQMQVQGRMKSIYSIHKKIRRKHVGLREIYEQQVQARRTITSNS